MNKGRRVVLLVFLVADGHHLDESRGDEVGFDVGRGRDGDEVCEFLLGEGGEEEEGTGVNDGEGRSQVDEKERAFSWDVRACEDVLGSDEFFSDAGGIDGSDEGGRGGHAEGERRKRVGASDG